MADLNKFQKTQHFYTDTFFTIGCRIPEPVFDATDLAIEL